MRNRLLASNSTSRPGKLKSGSWYLLTHLIVKHEMAKLSLHRPPLWHIVSDGNRVKSLDKQIEVVVRRRNKMFSVLPLETKLVDTNFSVPVWHHVQARKSEPTKSKHFEEES